jgi:cytochrome c-type biogenesis protein CcmH
MPALWLSIAAVTVVALLVILWPLIRPRRPGTTSQAEANVQIYRGERDQVELDLREGRITRAERDRAVAEIESRLLEDVTQAQAAGAPPKTGRLPSVAMVIAAFVPIAAIGFYLAQGMPGGVPPAPMQAGGGPGQHTEGDQDVARLADALAERLKNSPDDARGWVLLARTNHSIGRLDVAGQAYERAIKLLPDDPDLLADYAGLLAQKQNDFGGRPLELAQAALKIDPQNVKALALLASAAEMRGDRPGAVVLWQRVLAQLPAQSEDATEVKAIIARLSEGRALPPAHPPVAAAAPPAAGAAPATAPPAASAAPATAGAGASATPAAPAQPASPPVAAAGGKTISGTITVKPELAAKIGSGDTLFVFARPADGPRMPLAALRASAGKFPFEFRLDDSLGMGGATLSATPSVVVEARVSKTGEVRAQAGDLFGRAGPVAPGASGLAIVIDSTVQ